MAARGSDIQCERRLFDLYCAMDCREGCGLAFVAVGSEEAARLSKVLTGCQALGAKMMPSFMIVDNDYKQGAEAEAGD